MKTGLALLGTLLVPAITLAQPPPGDPNAPPPGQAPPPPQAAQPPPPPPQPAPTVIINPPPEPRSVVVTEPRYNETYDSYNTSVFQTGAMVFAVTYGASLITAVSTNGNDEDERDLDRLYVPLVGPWLALNDRGDCDETRGECDNETVTKVLLAADGVFQAASVAGMLYGVFRPPTRRVVMMRTAKLDTKVHIRPAVVRGDPGLTVFGRF